MYSLKSIPWLLTTTMLKYQINLDERTHSVLERPEFYTPERNHNCQLSRHLCEEKKKELMTV
ncbi:hypothetical protein E2C01_097211 [Portunus trituberculatus]|uniref:Uncharacterized protein n=1 Tax=Portunus trituberculatus TaxID=210409 RepID=A0A5B7JZV6_PORTR|nr:hypothetical protein [Portunus trituberculatus]